MAIPRGKQYYVDFIVYNKSSPPDGRISGISGSQFTILWAKDGDTTMTDISSTVQPTISEIGTEGRYRFLLGPSYMDGDRISLEIRVPGNANAYIIPISIYTSPSQGGYLSVVTNQNLDKQGYSLTSAEHDQIRSGVWSYANRALTSVDNIVSGIWEASSRTLTSLGSGLVDEIWNRLRGAVSRPAGSFGEYLDAKISSRPSAADIWSYSSRTLTSFGTLISDIWSHSSRTLTSFGSLASDIWSYSSRTLTSFGTLISDIWSHSSRTLTNFGSLVSDIWSYSTRTLTSFGALANEIWGYTIEAGKSAAWMMRIMIASLAGKVNGAETNTPRFRDIQDSKNRITMVVDDSGNRTEVTLNGD